MPKLIPGNYDLNNTFYGVTGTPGLSYTAAKNLIAWWRLDTDVLSSGDIIDSSGNGHSCDFVAPSNRPIAVNQTPSGHIQSLTSEFDGTNTFARIATALEATTWDDLIGGAASAAKPFSISVWIRPSSSAGGEDTVVSFSYNDRVIHYWANYKVKFFIKGSGGAGDGYIYTSDNSVPFEKWTHVVATYTGGSGGDLNVYINGVLDNYVDNAVGDPEAISGAESCIGARSSGGSWKWPGHMADLAIWGTALSAADASALYNAKLGTLVSVSGFLNNPPRTILATRDNATGSYPTVSRIGDLGRTGRYAANFNDTSTVIFNDNVTVSYPMDLQSADATYISQSIATPNTNATIEATGIVRKGVSDANITFTPGEDLKPFVEDKLYASTPKAFTDPFYLTGSTVIDVGLGFTNPLRSKTKIEIDLNPVRTTRFGEIRDNITSAAFWDSYRQHLMVYYNHDLGTWEKAGLDGAYWSASGAVPIPSQFTNIFDMNIGASMTAFSPGRGSCMALTGSNLRAAAAPISNFGFPVAAKFHATSSQCLNMSQFIDRPFVVEKFVLEFSSSVGVGNSAQQDRSYALYAGAPNARSQVGHCYGAIYTFFILNQRSPMNASVSFETKAAYTGDNTTHFLTASIPTNVVLSDSAQPTYVDTSRDLVTWGQKLVYKLDESELLVTGSSTKQLFKNGFGRELNISASINPHTNATWISGEHVMSGTIKTPNVTNALDSYTTWFGNPYYKSIKNIGYVNGGRKGIPLGNTGRDLTAAVGGSHLSGTIKTLDGAGSTIISEPLAKDIGFYSPYILKPDDNLVMGWQPALKNVRSSVGDNNFMELAPGAGKLTLYGSLITDGHEHHDGLNQPLTSDAIHEFIGFHGPPLDQFDTEPRQQFSGSMISSVVTGSMGAPDGYERRIVGERSDSRWIAGQPADPTDPDAVKMKPGSFYRSVITSEIDAEIYDSIPPSPLDIINANGFTLQVDHSVSNLSWGPYPSTSGPTARDHLWPRQFPFIPRFHLLRRKKLDLGLDRELQTNTGNIYQYPLVNCLIGDNIGPSTNFTSTPYRFAPSGTPISFLTGIDGYHNIIQIFFAIGGLGDPVIRSTKAPAYLNTPIQGYKYGLYHVIPKPALAHFRHSSYGQFRDMYEQRFDTRFYKSDSGRSFVSYGPVWSRFVSSDNTRIDPYKTSCSNMSNFSTSSLPYFDGVARNRGPVVTDELGTTVVSI